VVFDRSFQLWQDLIELSLGFGGDGSITEFAYTVF